MKEIKFRAWDTVMGNFMPRDFIEQYVDIKTTRQHGYFSIETYDAKGKRFILMQFTGLEDKNGKEIYDGDILKGNKCNFVVIFTIGSFMVKPSEGHGIQMLNEFLLSNGEKEIIGNIYENPELL